MTKPKRARDHTVPKTYLSLFVDKKKDKLLSAYLLKQNKVIRTSPEAICAEASFYSYIAVDGETRTDIENPLLSTVDSWYLPVLDKIKNRAILTDEERHQLATYVAFQWRRTPFARRQVLDLHEQLVKGMMTLMSSADPDFDDQTREIAKQTISASPEELEIIVNDTKKMIRGQDYKLAPDNNIHLNHLVNFSPDVANYLCSRSWIVYNTSKECSLVTTDNPVILDPAPNKQFPGRGVGLTGSHVFFPLSTNQLLLMECDSADFSLRYIDNYLHKKIFEP